jgi:hypothetical protein
MDEEFTVPQLKPRIGFILSIISAVFIILGSVLVLYISINPSMLQAEEMDEYVTNLAESLNMTKEEAISFTGSLYLYMAIFGFVSGFLVLLGGALAYYRGLRVAGGVIVLVFSLFSIIGVGGLFIGMILGIIGGVMILLNR